MDGTTHVLTETVLSDTGSAAFRIFELADRTGEDWVGQLGHDKGRRIRPLTRELQGMTPTP